MRKRLFAACLLAAMLPIGAATQAGAQSTEQLIRVGLGPEDDSTPLLYAQSAGLFKKAGLNVELENLPGSAVISAALAGGSLEIGKGSPVGVIAAYVKGLPFTVIGGSSWYNSNDPTVALIVSVKSGVKTAQDLAGRTLGSVTLQDLGTLATFAWLGQHGVDWKTLKFFEVPQSRALASMQTNQMVGMPVYEPILSTDVGSGDARVLGHPFDAVAKHFSEGVLFSNVSWVNSHRELVDRFLHVMQEADGYVQTHENETIPILAQFSGADPAMLSKMRRPERGVTMVPSDIQPVIDILAKYNAIPKAFPADEMICSCALKK